MTRLTKRRCSAVLATAAAAALALATVACASSASEPNSKPQVKGTTAAGLYVAPTGSDAGQCSQSAPCASFNRAYQLAPCGATIHVTSGSYPLQTIGYQPTKETCSATSRVVVQADGGPVSVGGINLGGNGNSGPKHVALSGLSSSDFVQVGAASDDIYLQNVSALSLLVFGASNVTVKGGSYGGCAGSAVHPSCPVKVSEGVAGGVHYDATNVTFDGVAIHDMTTTNPSLYHVECMFIVSGGPITIENSTFYHCQIYDIFVQDYNVGQPGNTPPHDVTLVNNWFGDSYADPAFTQPLNTTVALDARGLTFSNFSVRFNSFSGTNSAKDGKSNDGSFGPVSAGTFTGMTITGNLMMSSSCIPGATYSYNLMRSFSATSGTRPCGSGDVVQSSTNYGYVNSADLPNGDWHLNARSRAVALVPAGAGCPKRDIDGRTRSPSIRCDAGADQRRDTPACLRVGTKKFDLKEVWVAADWYATTHRNLYRRGSCPGTSNR